MTEQSKTVETNTVRDIIFKSVYVNVQVCLNNY
jgi:hypothetical protein